MVFTHISLQYVCEEMCIIKYMYIIDEKYYYTSVIMVIEADVCLYFSW